MRRSATAARTHACARCVRLTPTVNGSGESSAGQSEVVARNNINMQESAILFGMNNLASHGPQFLNNFYLKSKRSVEKARKEGPAAWVFPADDPRPGEQARLLSVFAGSGW